MTRREGESDLEWRRRRNRAYQARFREKHPEVIRWRNLKRYESKARRAERAAAKQAWDLRWQAKWRLRREERGLRTGGRLRWGRKSAERSSKAYAGVWDRMDDEQVLHSAQDALEVYGLPASHQREAAWVLRDMRNDAAATWLRENDPRLAKKRG